MDLTFRTLGTGEPLIILHGLFGSGDNWYSIARDLSDEYTVYLPDQRNHGNSPHHPENNYAVMSDDLYQFMEQQKIRSSIILGHSMGGKTALKFGMKHPERVRKIVVVDISPCGYDADDEAVSGSDQMTIVKALMEIDTENLSGRADADRQLMKTLPSPMVRQFLLKSLKRTADGKFTWAINVESLYNNMPAIFEGIISEGKTDPRSIPEFPLLFIRGERSAYIRENDVKAIRHFYPWAEITTIPGSGHWVHAEQPEVFVKTVRDFLGRR